VSSHAPPVGCDYETPRGNACPLRATVKITFRDTNAPPSISGEPVRFYANACPEHARKASTDLPAGMRVDATEDLP
jgi:hypothetical protein